MPQLGIKLPRTPQMSSKGRRRLFPQWSLYIPKPFPTNHKNSKHYPSKEAEDSSLMNQAYLEHHPHGWGKRFFPSGAHIYKVTLLLSESISTTTERVSHPYDKSWMRQKIPPHTYLLLSKFSPPLVGPTIKTTRAHIFRKLNMQAQ